MGGGAGSGKAGRGGRPSAGQVGGERRPGGASGAGLPSGPGFSPLTSLASAFHVGAKAMQWPHQEAKNSTAQALRESCRAPCTESACSSVSGSDGA